MSDIKTNPIELEDQAAQPVIYESVEAATEALEKMSAELLELSKRHNVTAQLFYFAFSYVHGGDDSNKVTYRYRTLVSGPSDLLVQIPEAIRDTVEVTIDVNRKRQAENPVPDEVLFIPDKGGQVH